MIHDSDGLPVLLCYFAPPYLRKQTPHFCQDLFSADLLLKTNKPPFFLLSTTFSWWTGSAVHTSDNTSWLSLPRLTSPSSLLTHYPAIHPACLSPLPQLQAYTQAMNSLRIYVYIPGPPSFFHPTSMHKLSLSETTSLTFDWQISIMLMNHSYG